MSLIHLNNRSFISIEGTDRIAFLQGLLTNDIRALSESSPLYACLLSPQGKILFDFLLYAQAESILLDVWSEQAEALLKRLKLYKLRANVSLSARNDISAYATLISNTNDKPAQTSVLLSVPDPRHEKLGTRIVTTTPLEESQPYSEYDQHRLTLGIPESWDIIEGRSFPMEFGIEHLHGISYSKGCYVGQEIIARSKMRGTLRKALYCIESDSFLPESGTTIVMQEKEIGQIRSHHAQHGLAIIRIDEATQLMSNTHQASADGAILRIHSPSWFPLPSESQHNT